MSQGLSPKAKIAGLSYTFILIHFTGFSPKP